MNTLIVQHIEGSDPLEFQIRRGDHKSSGSVVVASPFNTQVEGRPDSNLMAEMRWYLEQFLDYPYPPNTDRAEHITNALEKWGRDAFGNLFGGGDAGNWMFSAKQSGYQNLQLQIMSDDPQILQWPWEALCDPKASYVAVNCQIERRVNKVDDPMDIPEDLPNDRINILLVTARPYEDDVHYRSISRPLVELIEKNEIPAHVTVLRPPTFDSFRSHLKERPHFYHIVHFDGHGGYGRREGGGGSQHVYVASEGVLVFEDNDGKPDAITAEQLSGLLREVAVPAVVLNACQSAMLDQDARDPFASVAASLIKAGIRSVTAMAYSLYVSGAQEFLPAFYGELFESGNLSKATRAGRQKMFGQTKRVCARGRYELKDFVVPVIYQQDPPDLSFVATSEVAAIKKSQLPEDATDEKNPYGFIGRDREILKLERAIRKDTPAVLIHGLGGVGKTTLARGFVKWLNDTEGMAACLWIGFIDVRSAEYVVNAMGSAIFGKDFLTAQMEQKIGALADVLRNNKLVVVWDNFEVAAGIPGTYVSANLSEDDRTLLHSLLEKIRGGKGKVIITSRSEEDWLGIEKIKVSIGGLIGEERWEYCEKITGELGIPINREDSDIVELMRLLDGHPLAMRVILPKLEKMTAREITDAVRSNMEVLGPEAESLYGTLRFATDNLSPELKPLLIPLGMHEQFAQADMLEGMAKQVDEKLTPEIVGRFLSTLGASGLLRSVVSGLYELHPALTGFLRSTLLESPPDETRNKWSRAFVDVMAILANQLGPLELHEQRFSFHCHGANFRYALVESERLQMGAYHSAVTQSLASFCLKNRSFAEAAKLYKQYAQIKRAESDKEGEAVAYHQLGMIAEEQRDFEAAQKWYLKSLAIRKKPGYEQGAASTYHQLGKIAGEQRDFQTAEKWYLKSLAIEEQEGNEHGAAQSYHELGVLASKQGDFRTAEKHCRRSQEMYERTGAEYHVARAYHDLGVISHLQEKYQLATDWYLKALAIKEKLGDENGAANTYHQLGMIAQELRDFQAAEKWYLKSLAIKEKQGNEHGAANTYHLLGTISEKQGDFQAAEKWYLKSLAIKEKQGNEHGAAITYGQLASLAGNQKSFEKCGKWYVKCIKGFDQCNDPRGVERNIKNFLIYHGNAPPEDQAKMRAIWEEAGLGPFPEPNDSQEE